jgi:transposase
MTYTLGIDLHKRSSVWVLLDQERNTVLEQHVPATKAAIPEAVAALGVPVADVEVAIEPVCGWRWYTTALTAAGLSVKVANPSQIRLIAESRSKTDRNDARMLADLLRADFFPESYCAPVAVVSLRSLVRERAFLVTMQTSIKNRLHAIVLAKGYLETVGNPLRVKNRGSVEALGDPEIERTRDLLAEIAARIRFLEQDLTLRMKDDPTARLLMTMPGIGVVTAAVVLAEVGDFGRFTSGNHLASYAGLVPSQRSSGDKVRMGNITRKGSVALRCAMVEAAFRIRSQHSLSALYERLAPRIGKRRARVALARKMLTILWSMVHEQTPYDEGRTQRMTKRAISTKVLAQ